MKLFQKWLVNGCVYYTVIALLMILINLMLSDGNTAYGINLSLFFMFFPCGLGFSLADIVGHSAALPRWGRYLSHYGIVMLSLWLFVWAPARSGARGSTALIMLLTVTLLYWMLFGIYKLLRSRIRRLMEKD